MSRFLWLSLIFCVAISLIWWPGAKNEASIFELIERERSWQMEHLGFDLVDSIDIGLQSIQSILLTSPIPAGGDSTLAYSVGETDHELQAATHRIAQQPYFQVVIGRIGEREIDFVAESSDGFTYFQVAMSVMDPTTLERELSAFNSIRDAYPRYLITTDRIGSGRNFNGIIQLNAADWLLGIS